MSNYFPNTGTSALFNVGPYYGSPAFKGALNYYLQQLQQSNAGKGATQLAATQASDPAAAAERQIPGATPGEGANTGLGTGAFGAALAGERAGSQAGNAEAGNQMASSEKGGLQVEQGYGNSMIGADEGQIAEGTAQNNSNSGIMGDIMGGTELVGGLVGSYFGLPTEGIALNGAQTLIGTNTGSAGKTSASGTGGVGGLGSLMPGGGGSTSGGGMPGMSMIPGMGGPSSSPPSAPKPISPTLPSYPSIAGPEGNGFGTALSSTASPNGGPNPVSLTSESPGWFSSAPDPSESFGSQLPTSAYSSAGDTGDYFNLAGNSAGEAGSFGSLGSSGAASIGGDSSDWFSSLASSGALSDMLSSW